MNYRNRRERLEKKLENFSINLIYSGEAPYKVADEKYPFEVNRDFYYLTGIDREKMILLMLKQDKGTSTYLFIERYDETMAKWVGPKMLPEQAYEISGISQILYLDEFEDTLGDLLNYYSNKGISLGVDLHREEFNQEDDWLVKETRKLKRHYPTVKVSEISTLITEQRLVKDEEEINELVKAINITNTGLKQMWTNLFSGMNEAEAEAWFNFEVKKARTDYSFDSIFASGKNATTLHYSQNNTEIKPNTLLLTDLGATSNHYCADITRTVPVDGKFSPRQREIYDLVLKGNKHIISYARAGMTLRELNEELLTYYNKELPKHGLLKKGHSLNDYYFHGVSHMLGLQCHDVSIPDYKLRNGNVFTVEPGLYIEEEGIGIRIEDNVVIKNDKAEVLSSMIMKDPDEIEAFFAKR